MISMVNYLITEKQISTRRRSKAMESIKGYLTVNLLSAIRPISLKFWIISLTAAPNNRTLRAT